MKTKARWQNSRTRGAIKKMPEAVWVEFDPAGFPVGVTGLASEGKEWSKDPTDSGYRVQKYVLAPKPSKKPVRQKRIERKHGRD